MRRTLLAMLACLLLATPSLASAGDFGPQGTLSFGAERMFGLSFGERTWSYDDDTDFDVNFALFGLGWQTESSYSPPFNLTRLGIDYFVIDSLSIGGTFGFFAGDVDTDVGGNGNDGFGILFAPRVGYYFDFANWVGLWLRGGPAFYFIDDVPFDQNQFLLGVEAAFIMMPAEGFGFILAPTIDFGFFGESDLGPGLGRGDPDMREWAIGLQLGLLGFMNL